MIKSFLIITSLEILLFASQQIVLVVADDFNTSKAQLEFYDDNIKLFTNDVNIGKNGLAWGIGEVSIAHQKSDPIKQEGDKKAPAGIFKLTDIFGYKHQSHYKLPYLFTHQELICVDDSSSSFYNTVIMKRGDEKSFENMKRDDEQYKLGVVVGHNTKKVKNAGSCIFLHIEKSKDMGTLGCTSMEYNELEKIVKHLDANKNPILIQIPFSASKEILKLYPFLESSSLLHPHHL
ncbi:MAG: L,D-transpeptidase family protein [Campylobacterales bacterium]|nr:L,D-transpeptidase family protein [Campylobacterales bacterium]